MRVGWLAVLLLLAIPGAAAEQTVGPGEIYLPEGLVVESGSTLRVRPGTGFHGPGYLEVRGALEVDGTQEAPVRFRVPLVLLGNATARLDNATIQEVAEVALTVHDASLTVTNGTFSGSRVGISLEDAQAQVRLQSVEMGGHREAAVRVVDGALLSVEESVLRENGAGVWASLGGDAPLRLEVAGSRFESNAEHARLEFGATPNALAQVSFASNGFVGGAFLATSDRPAQVHDETSARVLLQANRFVGADVGLTASGGGFVVESRNDTFLDNRIGLSAIDAHIDIAGSSFSSLERDIDTTSGSRLQLVSVSLSHPLQNAQPIPVEEPLWPWLALTGLVLAGGGLFGLRRFGARARPPAPDAAAPAEPPQEADPDPPAAPATRAWSAMELRILHDVAAHPDSAQTEIARRLGLSRQALHYHVKKLAAAGDVTKTHVGRTTQVRLRRGLEPAALPPVVTQQDAAEKR